MPNKTIKEEMQSMTLPQMIKVCDEAIHAILIGGQSYTIGSRNITRANLTEIRNLRAELMAEFNASQDDESLVGVSLAKFITPRN